ncbi:MAG: pyridoxamine 5'-phosphate oxidase family protein [Candidatus Eremiobacteraeota bacterium]|nr:pyridoxamine 5'-phosphate oxidase family protein [Candidatus Eremiobacteraeota bacterium]MBV9973289.1 pyridoxamine 5'-phosphate oxidase family protein [Candidatus Eremiobacteraeota bacterium]
MIEVLSDREIEEMLAAHSVGRLGCHADGRTCVVPIAYAYSDGAIYGHSSEGLKMRMMRKNPQVCFEVDEVDNVLEWRSVVAWGTFEELHGVQRDEAMRTLLIQFLPAKATATTRYLESSRAGVKDDRAVIYRVRLYEKTGRCERSAGRLVRVWE